MARKDLEARTVEIGKEIFERMAGEKPSIFDTKWWSGKVMDWCMADPAFKLEMFRFVDVFPQLNDSAAVKAHLKEYFLRPEQNFPKAIQLGVKAGGFFAGTIEKNLNRMATQFIAGRDPEEAFGAVTKMREEGLAFTLDLLGEKTVSEPEGEEYQRRYLELLDGLEALTKTWGDNSTLDHDHLGPIPKLNISIKISTLYSQAHDVDHEQSVEALYQRLKPIFRRAQQAGAFVMLDLEHYGLKNITFDTFERLLADPELKDMHLGVVIQAYLVDSLEDTERLIKRAKKLKRMFTVRLVKGAYWDYETVLAQQNGWAIPVFTDKPATDARYEELIDLLLKAKYVKLAVASHNVRSIAHAIGKAEEMGLPQNAIEFQTLFGMAEPIKKSLVGMGYRVRDYTTVGELIPGMAYLVRRLLENTSNESFLRTSFTEDGDKEALLVQPQPDPNHQFPIAKASWGGNCPRIDFRRREPHKLVNKALATLAKKGLGKTLPVVVSGQKRSDRQTSPSVIPWQPATQVADCCLAQAEDIEDALKACRAATQSWGKTTPAQRAAVLRKAATIMTAKRYDLLALQVYEVGKSWEEADADVCEAIDFLNYYAAEIERLGQARELGPEPGEQNLLTWQPLGVGVIIAPWNFPLAIITGMTSAALAAGNAVVVKPARTSPACGYAMFEILMDAGIPKDALHFLPSVGAQVGPLMVESPEVDFITFTGSLEVGLDILQRAAVVHPGQRNVKRVVVEMGGKNAIIVDGDADLDEAVTGVVHSAFGFQGQKCSACSRVIVLEDNYDAFVERLVEATKSLHVGEPTAPGNTVGAVIDAKSQDRIKAIIEGAKEDFPVLLDRAADMPGEGYYVGPTIFGECDPNHSLCQEEIFGPVLAVIKAKNFDEALAIANGTPYALTGAVFSRSPSHLDQARAEFNVGNLYLNRGSTGAIVGRQAFGGSKMSGVGSKAGGPDYVQQFMEPKSVTENTMRRGFSPETL